MARTHKKVSNLPAAQHPRPDYTPETAAEGVVTALRMLEGRWKLLILFRLFGGKVLRFSELERTIPGVSQKMLAQQLRQLERDGIVCRTVHPEVPPRVEYCLSAWGQSLCPALDELLKWCELRPGWEESS
jgi:DNA-binding HxlR family transcriptional regulator